ncbi:hypothetical protein AB4084_31795, partial [Lysobacter sp. 2RAB21]
MGTAAQVTLLIRAVIDADGESVCYDHRSGDDFPPLLQAALHAGLLRILRRQSGFYRSRERDKGFVYIWQQARITDPASAEPLFGPMYLRYGIGLGSLSLKPSAEAAKRLPDSTTWMAGASM